MLHLALVCLFLAHLAGCGLIRVGERLRPKTVSYRQQFNQGYQLVMNHRYDNAIELLDRLVADTAPENEFRDDGLFWIAYSYQQLGRNNEAIDTYERLIGEHPASTYARLAREQLELIRAVRIQNNTL